jgi:uncharacterized protein
MEFEWDEAKSKKNLEKHGVEFKDVLWVFDGRPFLVRPARNLGEERFATTAESAGVYVTIIWTQRGMKTRLISARRARDEEKREYRDLHG